MKLRNPPPAKADTRRRRMYPLSRNDSDALGSAGVLARSLRRPAEGTGFLRGLTKRWIFFIGGQSAGRRLEATETVALLTSTASFWLNARDSWVFPVLPCRC